jgi:murein DD-endopeptidase MepM/ murein hydrolase activator NlpD
MNPRRPYNPNRKPPGLKLPGQESDRARAWPLAMGVLTVSLLAVIVYALAGLPFPTIVANPTLVSATPAPISTGGSVTRPSPASPEPTSTFFPAPSPSPTAIQTPAPTQFYKTQSGDTLPALLARFGVNPADLVAPEGLQGHTTLVADQLLVIPRVLAEVSPGYKIIPDSELIFSGAAAGFDPGQFAAEQGGYLAQYKGFADETTQRGGALLLLSAQHHSINPRLLTALLEYQSGWVTDPHPLGDALAYPYGYHHEYQDALYSQLTWATKQLAIGYYGWRAGTLTTLQFPDGSTLRLDPTLNAGTVAVQFYFAQILNRPAWEDAVGPPGLAATYATLFGDPFAHAVAPLIPADLTQPPLALPFQRGHTWYYTGGPHGAWENGGALAALDFAPASFEGGCVPSFEWVTAMAAGKIVRAEYGSVLLDLDGDGREATGWVILYLHIADKDRVPVGEFVEAGDHIGHPSCLGGVATGTHVHVARKYNGEWILADGVIPFDLSGWIAQRGQGEYFGSLTRDGVTIDACTCGSADTAITADR